jgi:hypothetical protein
MDEYNCYTLCAEDGNAVRSQLDEHGSVVFPLTGDRIGCLIVLICKDFMKLGVMPFGGNPFNRIYVGIYGKGCNHFEPKRTEPGYFAEKLRLSEVESQILADFWLMIWATP